MRADRPAVQERAAIGATGLAKLLGRHGRICSTVAGDAVAAQVLGNEQGRPPKRSSPLRPLRVEGHTGGIQFPDVAQRGIFLQKYVGGRSREYLFGRVDSGHDAGHTFLGDLSPLRRMEGGRSEWLIIGLIGPRWSGVRWRLCC